jgi:predicted Zn-dependent peptidase
LNNITRTTLCEGVNFTSIKDSRFKQNFISVNFMLPLQKNTAARNALLPMVLRRGCADYPDMTALNQKLKELYGAHLDGGVVKRGEIQIVSMFCEMLSSSYALENEDVPGKCATLLKSVIFDPVLKNGVFLCEDVDIERRNLVDLIESQLNDKRSYASRRLKEEMCKNEAYGISEIGSKEDALLVTSEMLVDAWKQIINNARVEMFYVGDADSAACKQQFTDAFGCAHRGRLINCTTQVIRDASEVKFIEEKLPVAQAKLVMGFRAGVATPDSEVAAMQLACTIFGGSPHSKLFANVREKMSLCYYCYSRFERQKGLVFVDSGIETENFEQAKAEILKQLEDVKNGNFTDDELRFAAMSLENSYKELSDSLSDLNNWYLGQAISDTMRSPSQTAEEIMSLKREDVINVIQKIQLDTIYLLAGAVAEPEKEQDSDEI